jgi:hypothetical protein
VDGVSDPDDVLARARAAAAAARAEGRYAEDLSGFAIQPTDAVTPEALLEWAVVEPDPDLVYSTRRFGAPITWIKRGLMWAMRQYHAQMLSQQARYNIQLVVYVTELEERIAELEARLEES